MQWFGSCSFSVEENVEIGLEIEIALAFLFVLIKPWDHSRGYKADGSNG